MNKLVFIQRLGVFLSTEVIFHECLVYNPLKNFYDIPVNGGYDHIKFGTTAKALFTYNIIFGGKNYERKLKRSLHKH